MLCEGEIVTKAGLGRMLTPEKGSVGEKQITLPAGGVNLEEVERSFVQQALERSGWVQKEAAKLLGVSSRVLNYKIKRFGMTHPTWKLNR